MGHLKRNRRRKKIIGRWGRERRGEKGRARSEWGEERRGRSRIFKESRPGNPIYNSFRIKRQNT